jgi:deoxycytidylate deaminase
MKPNWDDYFMGFAQHAAARGSCPRASVGAVIVKDFHIIGTGYNGAASKEPECIDVGCDIQEGHCIRAVHAEQNAIVYAARYGIKTEGAALYVYMDARTSRNYTALGSNAAMNKFQCNSCRNTIITAGIKWIIMDIKPAGLTEIYRTKFYINV